MSARKIGSSELFQPVTVHAQTTRLDLPAGAVRVRRNGIEFQSQSPIPVWTEMTVDMRAPQMDGKVQFSKVMVACDDNRHASYTISMLFTNISKQTQARLNSMTTTP